ncbi:GNAT family N-acetyltransferase [Vibrio sp. DW001]|uniref:GNAT family N-acetyltransferase n=1 Tax=Vibrio sp. DW001 TaxID=2912315 RepID=UPI0023B12682|nr:GNAT family N-acetyltransferase [Vibrio sp. DW001]WED27613.1 GNAT family N-acetyltransferase [Vibrio sp. DW001]
MPLVSERLEMVQITKNDEDLFRLLHTKPAVISLCFDPPSSQEIKAKFESRLLDWDIDSENWLCLVMREKSSGSRIGITGFQLIEGVAEVGYLLLPEFHGKGYGTESLSSLIHWASNFLDILRYQAIVTEGNTGSERVLIKCGFSLTKIDPGAYSIGNKRYDDYIYSFAVK